jgi:hypothetical protein
MFMSKRPSDPGYAAVWCIHYRSPSQGLGRADLTTCEAGVEFKSVQPKAGPTFRGQPCFLTDKGESEPDALPCEKLRRPTPEEIAAHEKWWDMVKVMTATMPWRTEHKKKRIGGALFFLALGLILAVGVIFAPAKASPVTCFDGDRVVQCQTVERVKKHKRAAKARTDANGNLVTVRSATGKTAKVAARYRAAFQALVDDLEASGYHVDFMGGWRAWGSCRNCNAHPAGRAIDINQTARNRVTRRFPSGVTEIAARHGICHGAIWGNPDRGHFEIADASRSTQCRAIANKGWPRVVERGRTVQ